MESVLMQLSLLENSMFTKQGYEDEICRIHYASVCAKIVLFDLISTLCLKIMSTLCLRMMGTLCLKMMSTLCENDEYIMC